ncbi:MAG: aminopeptidase [Burkholderiaceae bacterium]|nr:aminopeptidase [Burkholderiaceae bacterium]
MLPRALLVTGAALLLGGCAQIGYYAQAVHGEMSVLHAARPIDDVMNDPGADASLKARLGKVKEIRAFAVAELDLPDNRSYSTYADLKRPYVLWNVVATPELSLTPIHWCFPVAGCVSYRGYYHEQAAQEFAAQLRAEGDDVLVGGVPAYSTLGWFNDPVLSTFIDYSDAELARMLFHELAHQLIYVKNDSQFNESFATTVEEEGLERWLAAHGEAGQREAYALRRERRQGFLNLLLSNRKKLEMSYASEASDDDKRARKAEVFREMRDEYQVLKAGWNGYSGYDTWFVEPLSNARFASVATYHDLVPAFKALLAQQGSFPAFYDAVRRLAALGKAERHRRLALLMGPIAADDGRNKGEDKSE